MIFFCCCVVAWRYNISIITVKMRSASRLSLFLTKILFYNISITIIGIYLSIFESLKSNLVSESVIIGSFDRWVGSYVVGGRWSVGWWSVDLIKPRNTGLKHKPETQACVQDHQFSCSLTLTLNNMLHQYFCWQIYILQVTTTTKKKTTEK